MLVTPHIGTGFCQCPAGSEWRGNLCHRSGSLVMSEELGWGGRGESKYFY